MRFSVTACLGAALAALTAFAAPEAARAQAAVGTGAVCAAPSASWIFCDGFESGSLSAWQDVSLGGILSVQSAVVAAGGRALAAAVPVGSIAENGWAGRYFGDHPLGAAPGGPEVQDVYIAARVRFSDSWEMTYGKMFTIAAFESWSAGYPEPMSWSPYYVLLQYNHMQAEGVMHSKTSGASKWRAMFQNLGTPVTFARGRWYEMQYRVKLNTPGRADGLFEMWIDGVKKASYADVNYRDSYAQNGWNHMMLTAYQNGGPATRAATLYWDEVILSPVPIAPTSPPLGPPGRPQLVAP